MEEITPRVSVMGHDNHGNKWSFPDNCDDDVRIIVAGSSNVGKSAIIQKIYESLVASGFVVTQHTNEPDLNDMQRMDDDMQGKRLAAVSQRTNIRLEEVSLRHGIKEYEVEVKGEESLATKLSKFFKRRNK